MTHFRANMRMNRANSIFYQERYAEAEREYARAIDDYRDGLAADDAPDGRWLGQALMLRANALWRLGEPERARKCLDEGIALYEAEEKGLLPLDEVAGRIEFHSKAAEILDRLGDSAGMLRHADAALDRLNGLVRKQTAENFWESLLGSWHRAPGRKVKGELAVRRSGFAARALVTAEAAKGRLLYRQLARGDAEAEQAALDEGRQREALDRVRDWCAAPGRRRAVVSVFADNDGLAVFALTGKLAIGARWETQLAYQGWLRDSMDPWDDAIGRHDRRTFAAVAKGVLGEFGSALWRARPELAEGGDDLVLLPHKAFRNLPLGHVMLPTGARLGELFRRVFVYPTLWDFGEQLRAVAPARAPGVVAGCVDPEGNLPFAQLEGWLCCDRHLLSVGAGIDRAAIRHRLERADVLLLSCHGVFDPADPWRSALYLGADSLAVRDLVDGARLPSVVVLGACEAGLTRRSASDEPVGFAGILLRGGASAVLAPLWSVDDCASALVLTDFMARLRDGADPAQSLAAAAAELRDMTAAEGVARLARWRAAIARPDAGTVIAVDAIAAQIAATTAWLESLPGDDRPWSLIDWGAFQLIGGYYEDPAAPVSAAEERDA